MSVPQVKLTRMLLLPSNDSDVISWTPGTVAIISSRICVTRRSMTSGLAPSYSVRTVTVGSSILGKRSMRNRLRETAPIITTISVTMTVKMGCRTLALGKFMGGPPLCGRRRCGSTRREW